ncbi:hypothetical protein AURDEDRAFT_171367 [Auricularia subglabra TFB-10046 SS5]|uniref:Nephrocystin 3-like N-terminal domain-containing protein n=1 Tax=Auricularia subglabra (strain TFB-10046 / SS5) TaxID=717982 RepID=J0D1D1_AURST|nr:hypothetical protein AURDEDRAFT_171367 [Auricularia subglabra TFB-10046 SS5]
MSAPATPTPVIPARRASTKVDDALSGAETLARFVAEGVSGSGVKGLEGPAKTVLGIISHVKRVRDNSSACKEAIVQINALSETLKKANDTVSAQVATQAIPAQVAQRELGSSAELASRISHLDQRLNTALADAQHLQKQSRIKRVVMANRNADLLKAMSQSLQEARNDFMLTGQLAIELVLRNLVAQIEANNERQAAAELASALDKLPYADASYRASVHARHGRLLAGTRVQLLADLDGWAAGATGEPQSCPFYVLTGGAGTGKSTIAYEVASRAEKAGRLGASFFFMRGAALLSSTDVFFPTISRQLIANIPELHGVAVPAIHDHLKHGSRQNMDQQAKDLFTGLLSGLSSHRDPIILVIDAVDECTESAQDLVPRMLFLIVDALSVITCPVRVFVTSRPEVHVEDAFQSIRFVSHAQKFILHKVPRPVVDSDIRFYFQTALAELPEASRSPLLLSYPDASEDLTDLASGLFIYAATAIEFLRQYRRSDIVRAMDLLIATRLDTTRAALARLDDLYTIVLSAAFPRDVLSIKKADIRTVLGCVVALQDHISPRTLAALTGLSLENVLLPVVDRLGAVLNFDPNDADVAMRPLHASFAEFLVDPLRCIDQNFHIDPTSQHAYLSRSCLSWLAAPEHDTLQSFLQDILRIAFEFSPAIKACPGQLYTPSELSAMRCRGQFTDSWTPWLDIVPSGSHDHVIPNIGGVHFAPHGRWVATSGTVGAIHLCIPATGAVVQSIPTHPDVVEHLDVSSNGLRIVSASSGRVFIVSTRSGAILDEADYPQIGVSTGTGPSKGRFSGAFFVLGGRAVLLIDRVVHPAKTTLCIWDLKPRAVNSLDYLSEPLRAPRPEIQVSSNGRWAIVVDTISTRPSVRFAIILDLEVGAELRRIPYVAGTAAFIPNTESAVFGNERTLCIVDVSTGDVLRDLGIESAGVLRITVSQDGEHIAVLSRFSPLTPDAIHVSSLSGQNHRLYLNGVSDISLTPDGRRIVGLTGPSWRLVDIAGHGLSDPAAQHADEGTVTYALDITIDGTMFGVARHDQLSLYDHDLALVHDLSLPPVPAPEGMPLSLRHMESKPRGIAFSQDAQHVVVVRRSQLLVCDALSNMVDVYTIGLPVDAIVEQQQEDGGVDADYISRAATFCCAAFMPDGGQLIAFVEVGQVPVFQDIVFIACWDLYAATEDGAALCWLFPIRFEFAAGPQGLRTFTLRRALVAATEDGTPELHFAASSQGRRTKACYTMQLDGTGAVASTVAMPDEQFWLSQDGWIRDIYSNRAACWIPRARRPSMLAFDISIANRGGVVALVTGSGFLTVLDIPGLTTSR